MCLLPRTVAADRGIVNALNVVMSFVNPDVDTAYIEPQQYNLTAMIEATRQYDYYRLSSGDDYSVSFSPKARTSVGPYICYSWALLGYMFDINFGTTTFSGGNTDINLDLYTSAFGVNLLYRKMGGYDIQSILVDGQDISDKLRGISFPGHKVEAKGINAYYVLSPQTYSHQAIYSQTNRQIRSAGSFVVGAGYDKHSVKTDWDALRNEIRNATDGSVVLSEDASTYDKIDYATASFSLGYGYNWAFAKNWVVGSQLVGSVSYIWSSGIGYEPQSNVLNVIRDFTIGKVTLDATYRLGIVWNNSRWFAGANAIVSSYNYHHSRLWASNNFASLNAYVGFNFWRSKKYRTRKD